MRALIVVSAEPVDDASVLLDIMVRIVVKAVQTRATCKVNASMVYASASRDGAERTAQYESIRQRTWRMRSAWSFHTVNLSSAI